MQKFTWPPAPAAEEGAEDHNDHNDRAKVVVLNIVIDRRCCVVVDNNIQEENEKSVIDSTLAVCYYLDWKTDRRRRFVVVQYSAKPLP